MDGAGPYKLGATLASLQAANQLAEVAKGTEVCPENTFARGTGVWTDVRLSFRPDGKLYLLVNRSPNIPTPSGAWLGTSLNELKTIYNGIPGQELSQGPGKAYLVTHDLRPGDPLRPRRDAAGARDGRRRLAFPAHRLPGRHRLLLTPGFDTWSL